MEPRISYPRPFLVSPGSLPEVEVCAVCAADVIDEYRIIEADYDRARADLIAAKRFPWPIPYLEAGLRVRFCEGRLASALFPLKVRNQDLGDWMSLEECMELDPSTSQEIAKHLLTQGPPLLRVSYSLCEDHPPDDENLRYFYRPGFDPAWFIS